MTKHRSGLFALLAAAVCLSVALAARADDKEKDRDRDKDRGDKDTEALTDAQFVKMASAMDLAEVNLGRLAAQRAASADVKAFGQHMVADHTRTSMMLLALADKKGLQPAREMDRKHQALSEELGKLRGVEFDRAYMKHMVTDHRMAADLFRRQSKNGKDEDLRALAGKTLPTIEAHLKMAQELSDKLKESADK